MIPTLNLHSLNPQQIAAADQAFELLKDSKLLPFDQLHEDPVRSALDRALLVDVLHLDPRICEPNGPMDRLRRKLAAEPQIHANKQTRLTFTDEGEISIPL